MGAFESYWGSAYSRGGSSRGPERTVPSGTRATSEMAQQEHERPRLLPLPRQLADDEEAATEPSSLPRQPRDPGADAQTEWGEEAGVAPASPEPRLRQPAASASTWLDGSTEEKSQNAAALAQLVSCRSQQALVAWVLLLVALDYRRFAKTVRTQARRKNPKGLLAQGTMLLQNMGAFSFEVRAVRDLWGKHRASVAASLQALRDASSRPETQTRRSEGQPAALGCQLTNWQ